MRGPVSLRWIRPMRPLEKVNSVFDAGYDAVSSTQAVVAGLMYSTRLPERLFPGRFDLVGNSHHFMHVFVALSTEFGLSHA